MKAEYAQFIKDFIAYRRDRISNQDMLTDQDVLSCQCWEATELLAGFYPELEIVKGFYSGREHMWCVTPDGEIVDPTRGQFYFQDGTYRAINPEVDLVRHGTCPNCGGDIYGLINEPRKGICSPECDKEFREYLFGEDAPKLSFEHAE